MPDMTPADARRVLTEMIEANRMMVHVPDRILSERYVKSVEALTYALSQVWVPQDVAQAALPLVAHGQGREKYIDELWGDGTSENHAKWQALADALVGK